MIETIDSRFHDILVVTMNKTMANKGYFESKSKPIG